VSRREEQRMEPVKPPAQARLLLVGVALATLVLATSCSPASGSRRSGAGGRTAARDETPAAPASFACLLGATHEPILTLHGINPTAPDAIMQLAEALTASDLIRLNGNEIRVQLTEVAAAPDDPAALAKLADLLGAERRYGLASLFLDHAAAVGGEDPEVFRRLGDALVASGRPNLAIEAYDRGVSLKPEDGALWERLARACLTEGRLREKSQRSTRAALQKVRELNPSPESKLWAETALIRLDLADGSYQGPRWDARGDDGKPLGIGPLRVRTTAAFERAQLAREPAERLQLLEDAAREDPTNLGVLHNLALALLDAERYPEAVTRLEADRRIGAKEAPALVPEAMASEALCLAHIGSGTEADRLARAAIEAAPESAYARYVHGRVSWLAHDVLMAEERAKQALGLWPEHAPSLALLGECYQVGGELPFARRAFEYALWAEGDPLRRETTRKLLGELGEGGAG
jgi:tetratricopeptide (TPR) repeat protein